MKRYLVWWVFVFILFGCASRPPDTVGSKWVSYPQIKPSVTICGSESEAKSAAAIYAEQVDGELQYVPASFSMSRTFKTGDWYVIEATPFDQAGGYPMVFWRDDTKRSRILHYAVARNVLGEYITAGDGPRNVLSDDYLKISKPVTRNRYVGVVKRVFTWAR